jgi:hypothetical protein
MRMAFKIMALKIVASKITAPLLAAALTLAAYPAEAETIDVSDSHGGSVAAYDAEWAGRARGLTHEFIWMRAPDVYRYFKRC